MKVVCQAFLSVILVGAGLAKLGTYDRFLRTLSSLSWLPLSVARRAARAIPAFEIGVALLLVVSPLLGAAIALAMLVAFSGVLVMELTSGRRFRCGCFGGVGGASAGARTLVRNTILTLAALGVLLSPTSVSTGAVLTGAGLGLLFLLVEVGGETLETAGGR